MGAAWSRHVLGAEAPWLGAVIADDDGLLGVGRSSAGGTAWRSTDGVTWTASGTPDPDFQPSAVAVGDGRYVMAGTVPGQDGSLSATLLVSDDGSTWRPAATPPDEAFGVYALAFGDGRWIAVGSGANGLLWTSDDGDVWRGLTVPDASRVVAIAAGDAGFVVVGEGPSDQSGVPSATVLTSKDGVRWTGLEDPAPFGNTSLQTAAFGDGRYVVGGVTIALDGAVAPGLWTSSDLVAWEPAVIVDDVVVPGGSDGEPAYFEGAFVFRLVRGLDEWIATGLATDHRGPESMAQDLAIWRSSDGTRFVREPHERAFEIGAGSSVEFAPTGLAVSDGTIVITGRDGERLPTVWISPARPDGTEPSPRPAAATPGPTEPCCDATPAPMLPSPQP